MSLDDIAADLQQSKSNVSVNIREALRSFFTAVDAGISAFTQGKAVDAEATQKVISIVAPLSRQRR